MLKLVTILFLIFALQGCTTFRIGDLKSTELITTNDSAIHTANVNDVPVILKFYSTQGMTDKPSIAATKSVLLNTTQEHFPNQSVKFHSDFTDLPDEYLSIQVIRDIPDEREGEANALKAVSAIFAGATLMILPVNDVDIENHIKISHIKGSKKAKSTLYNQDSRRLIGFSMIPAAIFFNSDSSLSASLSEAIAEYLDNEV